MLPVNLVQLPTERRADIKAKQEIKEVRAGQHQRDFLHFSFVFVAAFGLADAVLPLPVQELLQLLLLPAWPALQTKSAPFVRRTKVRGQHSPLARLPELLQLRRLAFVRGLLQLLEGLKQTQEMGGYVRCNH